jgi:glycerol uptake facilitator-like aquaporin
MLFETLMEFTATFAFILISLMTDNLVIIFLSFALSLLLYGVSVGVNPLVTIPKALLGRHDTPYLHRTISAQLGGAAMALLTYHFLIKTKLHTKHKLDRF